MPKPDLFPVTTSSSPKKKGGSCPKEELSLKGFIGVI